MKLLSKLAGAEKVIKNGDEWLTDIKALTFKTVGAFFIPKNRKEMIGWVYVWIV